MEGQQIIQNSVMLRGRGDYEAALACIEQHIDEVGTQLRPTAWREAKLSADALNWHEKSEYFSKRAEAAELNAQPPLSTTEYGRAWAAWE
ncbi:MAG TPA: hypothetical protein VIC26_06440 [Marinagarivorans sp.]